MAASAAVVAVTVPIREGKAGEGASSIITEGAEVYIDVGRESTGEGRGGTSLSIVVMPTLVIFR